MYSQDTRKKQRVLQMTSIVRETYKDDPVIELLVDDLCDRIHNLGEKSAIELVAALVLWMVDNDGTQYTL